MKESEISYHLSLRHSEFNVDLEDLKKSKILLKVHGILAKIKERSMYKKIERSISILKGIFKPVFKTIVELLLFFLF
ncbi:hypothetical protein HMPREF1210_01037 [Paenisporosarcina sp. HGH0030]|nr:hypothetical protein HMPREF1210_01037 [Paenisporosarcina sp. HGH0030]